MQRFIKKLHQAKKMLNNGYNFNQLDPEVSQIFSDDYAITVETANKSYPLQKIWCDSFSEDDSGSYKTFAFFLENKKYDFTVNENEVTKKVHELTGSHIKYLTRKHPNICKALLDARYEKYTTQMLTSFVTKLLDNKFLFSYKIDKENLAVDIDKNPNRIIRDFKFYNIDMNYKTEILKNLIIGLKNKDESDVLSILKKVEFENNIINLIKYKEHEQIEDIINIRKHSHQYKLIISNKLTSKNKELFEPKSFLLLEELTKEGLTANDFHKEFVKKIAKYKSKDELEIGLNLYATRRRGWSKESYIAKIRDTGLECSEIRKEILLTEIETYEQSSKIGSSNWCIATDDYFFEDYTKNYQRQYFVYDFNKEARDPESMIGVTVNFDGEIIYAHDKNDDDIIHEVCVKNLNGIFSKLDKEDITKKSDRIKIKCV